MPRPHWMKPVAQTFERALNMRYPTFVVSWSPCLTVCRCDGQKYAFYYSASIFYGREEKEEESRKIWRDIMQSLAQ